MGSLIINDLEAIDRIRAPDSFFRLINDFANIGNIFMTFVTITFFIQIFY